MSAVKVQRAPTKTVLPTSLVCAGCGFRAPAGELPLRCPEARPRDDIDHLITRTIDPATVEWPAGGEENPFIRYRTLSHAYHLARAAGRSDAQVVAEIERLDDAVAKVDGRGFGVTPLLDANGTLVKNETGNVSGSHKARHLFGTLLALRLAGVDDPARPLAIASCGNAALAAAVVARAAQRELTVFVPTDADPLVLERLADLGATISTCQRRPGEHGDPTVLRLRERVASGALPFTCQGNENGLAIEGGLGLGYELADQLREGGRRLDRLFIQVGGGALASSVIQALNEAHALGAIERLPRIHAVQALNVHPLVRAHQHVMARVRRGAAPDEALDWAANHRSSFMRPWAGAHESVASGIVDDETYDWLAVVRGMVATGGGPLLVGESELIEANEIAVATTGINVDITGSAGLAGLIQLRRRGEVHEHEACAVLFTGCRRSGGLS